MQNGEIPKLLFNHKNHYIMNETDTQFWLSAAEDFRRFRKGEISMQELIPKYPEFNIQEGWRWNDDIKEAIRMVIPESCPMPMIPPIVCAVKNENGDVGLIHYDIRIAYQPAWAALPQWGKIKEICEAKEPVIFEVSIEGPLWRRSNKEPIVDIRYCVREGSHGDEDGFGIEPDTWIVGLLNMDGTWYREWYIED